MRLGLDEDAPVVVRRRVFLLEGEPTALVDSYYPAEWASGTAIGEPARIRGGVYALIEDPGRTDPEGGSPDPSMTWWPECRLLTRRPSCHCHPAFRWFR